MTYWFWGHVINKKRYIPSSPRHVVTWPERMVAYVKCTSCKCLLHHARQLDKRNFFYFQFSETYGYKTWQSDDLRECVRTPISQTLWPLNLTNKQVKWDFDQVVALHQVTSEKFCIATYTIPLITKLYITVTSNERLIHKVKYPYGYVRSWYKQKSI